jgi:hypothetical protein
LARRTSTAHAPASASLAGAGFATLALVVMRRRWRRAGVAAGEWEPPEVAPLEEAPPSPAPPEVAPSVRAPAEPASSVSSDLVALARPALTRSDWTCAITWHSGMRGASFRAMAFGPGVPGREIARSVKVDWPPIVPPPAEPDIVQAARSLARSLVAAGWQPADRGPDWYSQRFVWTRSEEPIALR